ncbi:MAG: ribosome biogenesis GTPase Der [Candidatus Coatesbacteria bacterium]|nr:MAG: ribosome biogenesis GTPase Der [Candidatus Coatesbacteria bacterium]
MGKSTLFNRLVGRGVAMTDAAPHTTRDVLAGICRYGDTRFELVDAAGFLTSPEDSLYQSLRQGLDAAVASADVVVLLFDAREGLLPLDRELADYARRLDKPVIPVVNKIDSPSLESAVADFFELGFDREPLAISAANGYRCAELLAAIGAELGPPVEAEEEAEEKLCVAIVGRPNVGKSSLLNCLVGAERVVVHEVPGTTRDAVDVEISHAGRPLLFVDTAGIRRRTRAKGRLEQWSLGKSFAAIRRAAVVFLVLDGAEGPTAQDAKIAAYADDHGRGLIIFTNKTDLLAGEPEKRREELLARIRAELSFASYAPVLSGSALRGLDTGSLYEALFETERNWSGRVGTGELNRFLREAMARRKFRADGKEIRLLYAAQVQAEPPTFQLFLNVTRRPPPAFAQFLENRLREGFPLVGTPVRLSFRLRRPRGR